MRKISILLAYFDFHFSAADSGSTLLSSFAIVSTIHVEGDISPRANGSLETEAVDLAMLS